MNATPEHLNQWNKYYEIYSNLPDEISQYRARCIKGLLDGTTYDYSEESH